MPGSLTHSPADVVRRLVIALGLGNDPPTEPWPVYVGGEPTVPEDVITVYDMLGVNHGREMIGGERQEHHGVMLRFRGREYRATYAKARAVAVALDGDVYLESVAIDASTYRIHCVNRRGDVLALNKESFETKRSLFTINATVMVRQVA
jgi:hypothetical protein